MTLSPGGSPRSYPMRDRDGPLAHSDPVGVRMFRRLFVAAVAAVAVLVASSPPSYAAGESDPTLGCWFDPPGSQTLKCGDLLTKTPGFPTDSIQTGYAPGLGTLPSTFTIGGAQTAARTAAGASAGSICGVFCMSLTSVGVGSIVWATVDQLLTPAQSNLTEFKPDPDPGMPWSPTYPCSHLTMTFTAGASTVSAIQMSVAAYQIGYPFPGQVWNHELCSTNVKVTVYATDGAGAMRRCVQTKIFNAYTGPTYSSAPVTQTGVGGTCTGTWVVRGVVAEPVTSGESGANMKEGLADGVVTQGTFNPGTMQYRAELRCESSDGGWAIPAREDIGRLVSPHCSPISGGLSEVVRGTRLSIYNRVVTEDGWTLTDEYDLAPAPLPATVDQYAQCYVAQGSSFVNTCAWGVLLDDIRCLPGGASEACFDWTRIRQTSPERVKCMMGPYVMPAEQCNWLEGQYKGVQVPAQAPNVDGNPDTWVGPLPQWQPQPQPSPTPTLTQTATASPSSTASPTATTSQQPTSTATATSTVTTSPQPTSSASASPTGGTGTDPGTGGTPGGAGQPSPTDTPGTECFPTGWGVFNPAEWVLKPVKCAMWWAFVPPSMGERMIDWWDVNKGAAVNSPLGQWWAVLPAWAGAFSAAGGGGGSCMGPELSLGFLSRYGMPASIYPFQACTGVIATAAAATHGFLTVSIGLMSGWRLVRIVGRPFGYDLDLMNRGRGDN